MSFVAKKNYIIRAFKDDLCFSLHIIRYSGRRFTEQIKEADSLDIPEKSDWNKTLFSVQNV